MNSQGGPIATGDRSQFAHELFDRHAEEVYHYVLAWTGDQASAVDLTTTVLRTAVARMDQLAENADAAELEMRLIALVRAAVTKWRARRPGEQRVATAVPEESMPLFEALGELDDNRREVLTLVELLGQEPERAGRLLGCDAKSVEAQRDESLESLWRAMNQAPPDQSVSTWDRLTVDTALRRAAAEWISPAEAVLGYVGEQLFGEAPVGVPATVPARGAAAKAPAGRKPGRGGRRAVTAVPAGAVVTAKTAAAAAAPLAEGAASGPGTGAPAAEAGPSPAAAAKAAAKLGPAAAKAGGSAAAAADGSPGRAAEVEPGQDGPWRAIAGLILFLRGRWAAWGIAAAAAAGLGVIAALTIGGPVSGSSQCATRLACLPSTTVAVGSGNAGEVLPAPTDAAGNTLPTTTRGPGVFGPAQGFPLRGSTSTTSGRATTTTQRVTGTTSPPKTTRTTSPPTTAPPTTAPPTTAPPATEPPTTPTTTLPAL